MTLSQSKGHHAGKVLDVSEASLLSRPIWNQIGLTPWPVMLFLLLLLLPIQISVTIGSIRLPPYRVMLLIFFVPGIVRLFSGGAGKVLLCDFFMLGFSLWMALSLCYHYGLMTAIETGGALVLDSFGAYLIARLFLRNVKHFVGFCALLTVVVIGLALFTIPESILGKNFLRPSLVSDISPRMGFDRAFGPFDHPILFGAFCASAVGMSWYSLSPDTRFTPQRIARVSLIGLSAMTSLSAGAAATLMVQLTLIVWHRATTRLKRRWVTLFTIFATFWCLGYVVSNRGPMKVMLSYLTFSAGTAYQRLIIFEHASDDAMRHPIFGIGFERWDRPAWMFSASIDNFWLFVAVVYGSPALLLFAGAILYILIRIGRLPSFKTDQSNIPLGYVVSMVGLIVAAVTVHFWSTIFVYMCFLVGAGVWLLNGTLQGSAVPLGVTKQASPTSGRRVGAGKKIVAIHRRQRRK